MASGQRQSSIFVVRDLSYFRLFRRLFLESRIRDTFPRCFAFYVCGAPHNLCPMRLFLLTEFRVRLTNEISCSHIFILSA